MTDTLAGAVVLAFRIGAVVALFLFVVQALRVLRAEAASGVRGSQVGSSRPGLLEMLSCEGEPSLAGRVYPLDSTNTIGRDSSCTVSIGDPRVSARHARLLWRGGAWWVEDQGSTNGTYVNGHRISGATRVSNADVIQVGPATLKVRDAP